MSKEKSKEVPEQSSDFEEEDPEEYVKQLVWDTSIITTAKILSNLKQTQNWTNEQVFQAAQIPSIEKWHYTDLIKQLDKEKEIIPKIKNNQHTSSLIKNKLEQETEYMGRFRQRVVSEFAEKRLLVAVARTAYERADKEIDEITPKYVKSLMDSLDLSSREAVEAIKVSNKYEPENVGKEMFSIAMVEDPAFHADADRIYDMFYHELLADSEELISKLANELVDEKTAEYISTLIDSKHIPAEKAIDAIGIKEESKSKFEKLVNKQQKTEK